MLAQQLQYAQPVVTEKAVITERKKAWQDDKRKDKVYLLRRVAADDLDVTDGCSVRGRSGGDKAYEDFDVSNWEEGRDNEVSTNLQIQVKSLVFNEPDLYWDNVRPGVNAVRVAYYKDKFKKQDFASMYRWTLLDGLISGVGNVFVGYRNREVISEYADDLDVTWDTAFKEPHKKRGVFYDKHLPAEQAVVLYPKLRDYFPINNGIGSERDVTVTCYWDIETTAVLYREEFLEDPKPNPYGRIPMVSLEMYRDASAKYADGLVSKSMGSLQQQFVLQRAVREILLRGGAPVLAMYGNLTEGDIDDIISGREGVALRMGPGERAEWLKSADVTPGMFQYGEGLKQGITAKMGVTDFQRGQTDTEVDFATQLSYIAQQSGIQGEYAAQQFEQFVKAHIELLMHIGNLLEGDIQLNVEGTMIPFDMMNPINPLLGTDGDIVMRPGGMKYVSPEQKLQKVMLLVGAIGQVLALPPGIQELALEQVLDAYNVDDKDRWMQAYQEGMMQQMMMQQQQMAMEQAQQQPKKVA